MVVAVGTSPHSIRENKTPIQAYATLKKSPTEGRNSLRAYNKTMVAFDDFVWHVYRIQITETKCYGSTLHFYDLMIS